MFRPVAVSGAIVAEFRGPIRDFAKVARPAHLRAARYGTLGPEPWSGLPTVAHAIVGKRE